MKMSSCSVRGGRNRRDVDREETPDSVRDDNSSDSEEDEVRGSNTHKRIAAETHSATACSASSLWPLEKKLRLNLSCFAVGLFLITIPAIAGIGTLDDIIFAHLSSAVISR
jgi:hypothetical protein